MLKRALVGVVKFGLFLVLLGGAAAVAFWVSLHHATEQRGVVAVPDLRGLDTREALSRVNAVGLRLVIEDDAKSQYDPAIPLNHVVRQDPAAGTRLKEDRRVRVRLSLGAHDLYVPQVIGQPVAEAQVRLHESGLSVGGVVYLKSERVSENVVIDQEPRADDGAQDGVVNLLVSSGRSDAIYVAPDFISHNLLAVQAYLENSGFKVKLEYEAYPGLEPGLVIRQRPRAGYPLRAHDVVWLWASAGVRGTF